MQDHIHKHSPNNNPSLRPIFNTNETTLARYHIEDPAVYTKKTQRF